jgi:DNA-binding protein HU-beta
LRVNKKDLVERVANEFEVTGRFARELVDTIFDAMIDAARRGEEVSIFGFGKFKIAERAARKGRNPATGEAVKIAASKNLKFAPASSLKASLNKRRGRKAK